jgi:hypothetical protein
VSPEEAREHLRRALAEEIPEERGPLFPAWPWARHRAAAEARAAGYAAATRRAHLQRLIGLPDRELRALLARGWDPRDRGDPVAAAS